MATPNLFRPSSPTTNRPRSDAMDTATINHLLYLPPLLQPISPSLAALHLARVRLLLSIPTNENVGHLGDWWCHACGGLREGLGGTSRTKRGGRKSRSGIKGKTGIAVGRQRKPAECSNCETSFKRPRPDKSTLITYPSARIAARRRKEALQAESDTMEKMDPPIEAVPEMTGSVGGMETEEETLILSRPSFSRVKDTEPNIPTYPPPPTSRSTSPDSTKAKGSRKKKKSGLAKLLAENKERAAQQNLGGSWGLG